MHCVWLCMLLNTFISYTLASAEETSQGYSYASNPLTLTTIVSKASSFANVTAASTLHSTHFSTTQSIATSEITSTEDQSDLICTGHCSNLSATCYNCNTSNTCLYGSDVEFQCEVKSNYQCMGNRRIVKVFKCIYCYLLKENVDYTCELNYTKCQVKAAPPQRFNTTCTMKPNVFCLGQRRFIKSSPCNWTSGYKWSTALALSITLGGFGADRFYLGYWKEALGKLFSFGGLGVWTLIDIVLIGTSYLMPADGSLYIF